MTTGSPAGAEVDEGAVGHIADGNAAGCARSLHLGMATEAEIRIPDGEHLGIDRAVRIVASRAAFAHRRVLKNHRLGLFPMALGAVFIQTRHRQSARRLHDVHAVRIVTLNAVHFAFDHGMMLRQVEFSLRLHMTSETRGRILAGVDYKSIQSGGAGHRDMFAGGTVTGLATVLAGHLAVFQVQSLVRAGGKRPSDIRVTIEARLVPDKCGALNLQRLNRRAVQCRAGIHQ